jgi:riboflavin kinase
LGIPTANIPLSGLSIGGQDDLETGIYFGWASLDSPHGEIAETPSSSESAFPKAFATARDKVMQRLLANKESESADGSQTQTIYPMVMSIGWNPFYKNTVRSVVRRQVVVHSSCMLTAPKEVHIMHKFLKDFYGSTLNLMILGYIRPEYDYVSKDSLIEDIETDIEVARRSLERPAYEKYREDEFLRTFDKKEEPLASL